MIATPGDFDGPRQPHSPPAKLLDLIARLKANLDAGAAKHLAEKEAPMPMGKLSDPEFAAPGDASTGDAAKETAGIRLDGFLSLLGGWLVAAVLIWGVVPGVTGMTKNVLLTVAALVLVAALWFPQKIVDAWRFRGMPRSDRPAAARVLAGREEAAMKRIGSRIFSATTYRWGRWIVGFLVFLCAWIYAISQYGFFLGVGLGWLPAAVIGFLAGLVWPVFPVLILAALVTFIGAVVWAAMQ